MSIILFSFLGHHRAYVDVTVHPVQTGSICKQMASRTIFTLGCELDTKEHGSHAYECHAMISRDSSPKRKRKLKAYLALSNLPLKTRGKVASITSFNLRLRQRDLYYLSSTWIEPSSGLESRISDLKSLIQAKRTKQVPSPYTRSTLDRPQTCLARSVPGEVRPSHISARGIRILPG